MAKPEWGTKHTCQNCGAKYYDMRQSPIVCPKCGTPFDPDALLRSRRVRTPAPQPQAEEAPAEAVEPAEEPEAAGLATGEEQEEDLVEGEEDEDMIEDASELGEDDMSDVVIEEDEKEDR